MVIVKKHKKLKYKAFVYVVKHCLHKYLMRNTLYGRVSPTLVFPTLNMTAVSMF